jgi:hypothetical protein
VTEGVLGDPARLEALRRTALLDTPPEEPFDRLTRLAPWAVEWIDPAPAIARRTSNLLGPALAAETARECLRGRRSCLGLLRETLAYAAEQICNRLFSQ